VNVIWHDLECGGYAEDMALWRSLAGEQGDPVLDIGAGTGRIALDLARRGHRVTALDRDAALLHELSARADGLEVDTVVADAREFELGRRFVLCVVPMQTIQLLGGAQGRAGFLRCVRRHLRRDGVVAIALSEMLECFDDADGSPIPLPDVCEHDGVVYCSQPTAARADPDGFVLERRRETVTVDGRRIVEHDLVRLDRLDAAALELEARAVGMWSVGRRRVPATRDYVGSTVVLLRA
jgi:SAM-dependent methyltransferase